MIMPRQLYECQKASSGRLICQSCRPRMTRKIERPNQGRTYHLDQGLRHSLRSVKLPTNSKSGKKLSNVVSGTQNLQKNHPFLFHAFERWEVLSPHWEA